MLNLIIKRDRTYVPFEKEKIALAIFKAANAVGGDDYQTSERLANEVVAMYNISVQRDGIALAAVLAENDSSYLEQWYSMRDNLGSLCTSLLNLVKTITSEDSAFVSISLMNDQNTDMVLLTILNSVVVYDSVDGTDLLGA